MNRVYLTQAERQAMMEQAARTTADLKAKAKARAMLKSDTYEPAPVSCGKASRPGALWTETAPEGSTYSPPQCDPTPQGIVQAFTRHLSSVGPVVPFSRLTHHDEPTWAAIRTMVFVRAIRAARASFAVRAA